MKARKGYINCGTALMADAAPAFHPTDLNLSVGTPAFHPTDLNLSVGTPVFAPCCLAVFLAATVDLLKQIAHHADERRRQPRQ
jgi:hypothetical protein